jgi:hypothetical protein
MESCQEQLKKQRAADAKKTHVDRDSAETKVIKAH